MTVKTNLIKPKKKLWHVLQFSVVHVRFLLFIKILHMAKYHNFEVGVWSLLLAYIISSAKFAWKKTSKIKQTGKSNTKNNYCMKYVKLANNS